MLRTPYEILGVSENIKRNELRIPYREKIHQYKQGQISAEEYRLVCRAYETLTIDQKFDLYQKENNWVQDLPIDQYTPQQLAVEPDLLSVLKERFQNATLQEIDAQDSTTGHTTLYSAARSGNEEAVSYLTEQGAEADLLQRTKSTALHGASFYGHAGVIRLLLESGASYAVINCYSNVPEKEAANSAVKEVFEELKTSPFVQAAANNINWFKERKNGWGKHIDEEYYSQRQTLLHCASKKGYEDLVRLFVEKHSANLDITDNNLNSALHLAAYGGHCPIVDYLLKCGCNARLENRWGMIAEQEGRRHGDAMMKIFENIREQDMFEMARKGVDWWFRYHFGSNSPNANDKHGTSLLYHACRYGQPLVAKWLLEHGADIDAQLQENPKSTALHVAVFYGHVTTVELLLTHGANSNIKNQLRLAPLEEGRHSDVDESRWNKVRELVLRYRNNLTSMKSISVHVYDDESSDQEPFIKVELDVDQTQNHLRELLTGEWRERCRHFSIARHVLPSDQWSTGLLLAVHHARYTRTHFLSVPLHLALHQTATISDIEFKNITTFKSTINPRQVKQHIVSSNSKTNVAKFTLTIPMEQERKFQFKELEFTFPTGCIDKNLTFVVQVDFSPKTDLCHLTQCLCLFTTYLEEGEKLIQQPTVFFVGEPHARLYTLASIGVWYSFETNQQRLPMIEGTHAFVRHIEIIPKYLILPPDMFIMGSPINCVIDRQHPVSCKALNIRHRDSVNFPHVAYHGTRIEVVHSILVDGFVVPGTVVSTGMRILPPPNHIPRGRKGFGVDLLCS
ncbi:unnamed protein product [Rotaria sp. Silwood1]|nr:unnamed protein product [Rotaria sp. Silwood1]